MRLGWRARRGAPNSTAPKSVTPMSASAPMRSTTSLGRADDGRCRQAGGTLPVEHRPVARQLAVDGEHLAGTRVSAVDVGGDTHRQGGDRCGAPVGRPLRPPQ